MNILLARTGALRRTAGVWAAPLVGVLFTAWFVEQEATRDQFSGKVIVFVLLGACIGVAVWVPWVSLGGIVLVPVLQLVGVLQAPSETTWPAYTAGAIVALVCALRVRGSWRFAVLGVGLIESVIVAVAMVRPTAGNGGGWLSWVGGPAGPADLHPLRETLLTLTLASFGVYAVMWGIGTAVSALVTDRQLARAQRRLEMQEFRLVLTQDRERIAREIHDALAHSLAVIVAQSEGALAMRDARPELAGSSLVNIAEVGRGSLLDVRRLIESIHDDDDVVAARPVIDDVDALISRMRDSGMRIEYRVEGAPVVVPESVQVAVFRILQEALTNALKHAGPSAAVAVLLSWEPSALRARVTSTGDRPLVPPKARRVRGVGIEGMRERARLAGGTLEVRRTDTTFTIETLVPTDGGAVLPEVHA